MSLLELSMEAKRLAAAARDGSLSPDEMTGATFTVTNIGSFGCEAFTPVVTRPRSAFSASATSRRRSSPRRTA